MQGRRLYPYTRHADQDAQHPVRHPVVIVGAGPVGLTLALDLGLKGQPVVVLDDQEGIGEGSRAICFAKRTLEICARLGAGQPMLDKGVVWNVGRVFHGDAEIYSFDLQPEDGHRFPAFVNLQQYHAERFLVEAIGRARGQGARIEIRGRNRVTGIAQDDDGATLTVETPDGPYRLGADWVVACDGARSPVRNTMHLDFEGHVFEDNFLIADVRMKADFPTERWFWFDPPFEGAGQSALLHKQPDDVWRLDFQLGWDIDREAELQPARIRRRVDAMLSARSGDVPDYTLEWTSIYTFQCRRMARFRHGRIIFAGDAAHQVSPFGARGANSGVQDADNLGWRLDLLLRGRASDAILDLYASEREAAADENILNSTRSTDFLTPKSQTSRIFRDAVLALARDHAFARPMVNSGRLSVPCAYASDGPDLPGAPPRTQPGSAAVDAPLSEGFLMDRLGGRFALLCIDAAPPEIADDIDVVALDTQHDDPTGALATRYLGPHPSAIYLIRPDQHIAARWRQADAARISQVVRRETGGEHALDP